MKSIIPHLALRFLLSRSSDGFISFISWVSIVGVALGVLALTVVTGVINGFEGELARVITGMNGDVMMYSRAQPIEDPLSIEMQIQRSVPEIRTMTRTFLTELMASGPDGVAGGVLQGFDPRTLGEVTAVPERVTAGRLPESGNEVALTVFLAQKIGARVGSTIRLIAPFSSKEDSSAKTMNVQVVGLVRMGMYEYDSKFIFMPLGSVQDFLEQPQKITGFLFKLMPRENSRAVADKLATVFGYPFRAKDWGQLNKNLFYAIQLEKIVIAIILTVIVVVAAFNVVSTLMMMIHDKTKEIAILKAMGFRKRQSFGLFCLIGTGIGAAGTVIGFISALFLLEVLKRTQWIKLPEDIYYISFLPVVVRWHEVAAICGMAVFISFVATLYPSWRVSRGSPLEGIRYE